MDDLFELDDIDMGSDDAKMPLIGDKAPEFSANTTNGPIKFPEDFMGKWVIFFSHPSDFTPVCTTEFIAFQKTISDFEKMNVSLLGLSVGALSSHLGWLDAISNMPEGTNITFPLIDDLDMSVAKKYGIIHKNTSDTHAVRAVFIIDPTTTIRAILYYPASLGRNMSEIWRMLVGLQTADAFKVATPANWMPGDDVLTPAPTTATAMRKQYNTHPWFITYKKLGKAEIYEKICKK